MKNKIKNFQTESLDLTKLTDSIKSLSVKNSTKEKVVIILGATSAGKSSLALTLAEDFDTEIISADSMSVYKNFNIGTAKPSAEDLQKVRHHLIDILEPEEKFSVVEFVRRTEKIITEINSRGKIPIVAGGTGLYIQALVEGYQFADADRNGNVRKSQESYFLQTGELKYDALIFGLTTERDKLYERINRRTKKMFDDGLIDEVRSLLEKGVRADAQAMQGIGYKETAEYLRGEISLEECCDKVSQATRNFAKRQLTWFRRMNYIKWLAVD